MTGSELTVAVSPSWIVSDEPTTNEAELPTGTGTGATAGVGLLSSLDGAKVYSGLGCSLTGAAGVSSALVGAKEKWGVDAGPSLTGVVGAKVYSGLFVFAGASFGDGVGVSS